MWRSSYTKVKNKNKYFDDHHVIAAVSWFRLIDNGRNFLSSFTISQYIHTYILNLYIYCFMNYQEYSGFYACIDSMGKVNDLVIIIEHT